MPDQIWPIPRNTAMYAPSELLPNRYMEGALPIDLQWVAAFPIATEQTDAKPPYRVFYLDDKDVYVAFYRTDFEGNNTARVIIVDGESKRVITDMAYALNICPLYTIGDEAHDFCVHSTEFDTLKFTFLIINIEERGAYLVRFSVDFNEIMSGNAVGDHMRLGMESVEFFSEFLARGMQDHEIAINFDIENVPGGEYTYRVPIPNIEEVCDKFRAAYLHGRINPQYTGLSCTEDGKYVIFVGSRVDTIYVSPYLSYPQDIQWLYIMDLSGMHGFKKLIAPIYDTLDVNEQSEGQPWYTCFNVFEGKHLFCCEERKHRHLKLAVKNEANENGDLLPIPVTGEQWDGGYIDDVYFVPRAASTEDHQLGYVSAWDESSVLEPVFRERIWKMIDIFRYQQMADNKDVYDKWSSIVMGIYPLLDDAGKILNIPSIYNDNFVYFISGQVIHTRLDRLTFFEIRQGYGGIPQDALYVSSLIPGESVTLTYYMKNLSNSVTLRNVSITIDPTEVPEGVTVSFAGTPTQMPPGEEVEFTVTAMYNPPQDRYPLHFVRVPFHVQYYAVYDMAPPVPVEPEA